MKVYMMIHGRAAPEEFEVEGVLLRVNARLWAVGLEAQSFDGAIEARPSRAAFTTREGSIRHALTEFRAHVESLENEAKEARDRFDALARELEGSRE